MMRARGHQSAPGSHQSARVIAPADTNPPRAATNPLAYARPRTPIRPGQPPIRSRMRAGGHQSAPDSHQSARVCAPARALGKGCPGERMPVPGKPFRFVGTALLAGKPFLTRRRGNLLGGIPVTGATFLKRFPRQGKSPGKPLTGKPFTGETFSNQKGFPGNRKKVSPVIALTGKPFRN